MIIQHTRDYSQFKYFQSNRTVTKNSLIESLKKKNMLDTHPIVVTKIGEYLFVIDGQHRLEAAKALDIPIYYVEKAGLEECHIPLLQNQKKWQAKDWLNHYVTRGYESYKFVDDMHKQYKISPRILVYLYSKKWGSPFIEFRKGTFQLKKSEMELITLTHQLKEILSLIKETLGVAVSDRGCFAIWKLMETKMYDHHLFLKKCDTWRDNLKDVLNYREAMNIFDGLVRRVFNQGARTKGIKEDDIIKEVYA